MKVSRFKGREENGASPGTDWYGKGALPGWGKAMQPAPCLAPSLAPGRHQPGRDCETGRKQGSLLWAAPSLLNPKCFLDDPLLEERRTLRERRKAPSSSKEREGCSCP
jgi:hypothetical protein